MKYNEDSSVSCLLWGTAGILAEGINHWDLTRAPGGTLYEPASSYPGLCVQVSNAERVLNVFGSVGLSVFDCFCGQHYSKNYERIWMKFYGDVLGGTIKN